MKKVQYPARPGVVLAPGRVQTGRELNVLAGLALIFHNPKYLLHEKARILLNPTTVGDYRRKGVVV